MRKLALLLAVLLALTAITALAESPALEPNTAYLMFSDGSWTNQYWYDGNAYTPVPTLATITGPGEYEVGVTMPEGQVFEGLAFMALGVKEGEINFPGYTYTVTEVLVNGEPVALTPGFTCPDDTPENTRANIWNEWVGNLPANARCAGGYVSRTSAITLDRELFVNVSSVVVKFTAAEPAGAEAYIAYASADWSASYWNDGAQTSITAVNPVITGIGEYEASLEFPADAPAQGVAFAALIAKGGETAFPGYIYTVTGVEVNGEALDVGKGFTCFDDDITGSRTNLYNEWVGEEAAADWRCEDGVLEGASAKVVDPAKFASVQKLVVKFTVTNGKAFDPDAAKVSYINDAGYPAFLMFADSGWLWQNMATGTAGDCVVVGDGVYEVFISKESMPEDQTAAPAANAQVFCVDITDFGAAMSEIGTKFSSAQDPCDVQVKIAVFVDGKRIDANSGKLIYGDIEGNRKLRIEIYNEYGSGTKDNPPVKSTDLVQAQELRVIFSLSGTGFYSGADTDLEAYIAAK